MILKVLSELKPEIVERYTTGWLEINLSPTDADEANLPKRVKVQVVNSGVVDQDHSYHVFVDDGTMHSPVRRGILRLRLLAANLGFQATLEI